MSDLGMGHRPSYMDEGFLEDIDDFDEEMNSRKSESNGGIGGTEGVGNGPSGSRIPEEEDEEDGRVDVPKAVKQPVSGFLGKRRDTKRQSEAQVEFKPQPPVIMPPQVMKQTILDVDANTRKTSVTPNNARITLAKPGHPPSRADQYVSRDQPTPARSDALSSEDTQSTVENLLFTSTNEAEAYTWNLIRQRQDSYIPESLIKISSLFWFPRLSGPLNLSNVIQMLVKIVREGLWSEVCGSLESLTVLIPYFQTRHHRPYLSNHPSATRSSV
ncbi:hypothetical protein BC829DRAFT_189719 [Chytridium lagenaria]|nr:hypothetical protein BC829DRAFT_189719 [Chytridium lagenaria]